MNALESEALPDLFPKPAGPGPDMGYIDVAERAAARLRRATRIATPTPMAAAIARPPTTTPMMTPKWECVDEEVEEALGLVFELLAEPEAEDKRTLDGRTLAGAVGCVPI